MRAASGMLAWCAASLCACSTLAPAPAPPAVATAATAPSPASAAPHLPPADDWRTLLPVPFDSTVAQVPFALKEVLLFQGAVQTGAVQTGAARTGESRRADSEPGDCFTTAENKPRLRGIEPDDYVLCFYHDRLYRVEAVLRLSRELPPETFQHWCAQWLEGLSAPQSDAERCAGSDADTTFEATLAYDTELAGPLVTVIVQNQATRELIEQRRNEATQKPPTQP